MEQFELPRTTLHYYDRIGLLHSSVRSNAACRIYGEREVERLRAIRCYRDTRLKLAAIGQRLQRLLVLRHGDVVTMLACSADAAHTCCGIGTAPI